MAKKENITNPTPEQIEAWKQKYGKVFELDVDGKKAYLRKPDRKIIGFVTTVAKTNPIEMSELLLENCWLGGDEEIKTNDDMFLSAAGVLGELMQVKVAELKNL
jgi:hypothetical protein